MDLSAEGNKEIEKINAAVKIMDAAQKNLIEMFRGIETIMGNTKNAIIQLDSEKQNLEKIKNDQANQISGLTDKQKQLLKEYEGVKEELEKFTKMAIAEGEVKIEDMKATLMIYRILLEEIWQSQPHFKVLYLLHGDKEEMTVDDIKSASGVSGAMVLRACHELSKANLISFDMDNKKAKLIKRLFPKKEKK